MTDSFTFRDMAFADVAEVASIEALSTASPWSEDSFRIELRNAAARCRVALCDGRIAGFLVSQPLGLGEGELLNLAVEPGSRRTGVGKTLLAAFLGEFPGGAYLEVRESNVAALSLYKSLGFKEVTRRPGYYDSPPEPAIVMKFHSC